MTHLQLIFGIGGVILVGVVAGFLVFTNYSTETLFGTPLQQTPSARTTSLPELITSPSPIQELRDRITPPPRVTPSPSASPIGGQESSQCAGSPPGPGYVCLQLCGDPAPEEGAPSPGWRWHSPEEARNRELYGCPVCLADTTTIGTPEGSLSVTDVKIGTKIWTQNATGEKITAPVIAVNRTPVPNTHQLIELTLSDGRRVKASPGHPTSDGRTVGVLKEGDILDGVLVTHRALVPYQQGYTYDILPAGDTGFYWADGVLLKSTLLH